jgi:hypothetical protein
VKEATINTIVGLEIFCWFFIGECIGKGSVIGYQVPVSILDRIISFIRGGLRTYTIISRGADPHHFNADSDPDHAPHQSDAKMRRLVH